MSTTKTKKAAPVADRIKLSVIAQRFVHVVYPDDKTGELYAGVSSDNGKLKTYKVTDYIYNAVLGTQEDARHKHLGLRQLTKVIFHLHLDEADDKTGTVISVDVIPKRMFVRGTTPTKFGEALNTGFEVLWDDAIQGYRVEHAYAGMSHKMLTDLLGALRKAVWTKRTTQNIDGHKVDKLDDTKFRITPVNPRQQFTRPT